MSDVINPNNNNVPGVFLNILSQLVVPKLVNKALDALDNKPVQTELSKPTVTENQTVIARSENNKQPKVTVNVNFFINDPEHKIDPSTYVPIRFVE